MANKYGHFDYNNESASTIDIFNLFDKAKYRVEEENRK